MATVRLVECTDYDVSYGVLTVKDRSAKEIQEKIYEIKSLFAEEDCDWCINDVFEQFPKDWEWDCVEEEIVEI